MVTLEGTLRFYTPHVAVSAALFSFALTGLAVLHARRRRWLSHPEERSSHTIPTPQVGGIGVCGALLLGLALAVFLSSRALLSPEGFPLPPPDVCGWLFATVAFGLALGLWDDLRSLSARPKVIAVGALAALATVVQWQLLQDDSQYSSYWSGHGWVIWDHPAILALSAVLAFLWIFFFINAFNFMDGVNGQSGVFAINALVWLLVYGMACMERSDVSAGRNSFESFIVLWWVSCVLAGALAGFLPWNFPRARTFLGDCGSLPVGALLATLVLALERVRVGSSIPGLFVLSPYIYDVLYTLVRRWRRGEVIWTAHRSHLYQRLLIATEWSHARLLAFQLPYWVLAGALGMVWHRSTIAYSASERSLAGQILATVGLAALLAGYTVLVWKAEARHATLKNRSAEPSEEPREDVP
jgi:UDP-N-acetylmuramyl pentapeptide phosphotransferase/UDP-N-acetylglucosamine-1-phosphate transferase